MSGIAKILKEMKVNPKGVRFNDLQKVCSHYFGKAKPYQVRQVLLAIEKIEVHHGS